MDPTIVGAVSALGGVLVGSLAESLRSRAAFRREKAWSLYELERSHLEATCEVLDQVRDSYGLAYGSTLYTVGMQKQLPNSGPKERVPWARLSMLVHLYLPQLKDRLTSVQKTGDALGSTLGDSIMASGATVANDQALIASMNAAFASFNSAVDAMRDDIVSISGTLRQRIGKEVSVL